MSPKAQLYNRNGVSRREADKETPVQAEKSGGKAVLESVREMLISGKQL